VTGPARAAGLALGFCADRLLGDPARLHPVSGFGRVAAAGERAVYADHRLPGALLVAGLVGGAAGIGALAERAARRSPAVQTAVTAVATWAVLGGRSLGREGATVAALLESDDLPAARRRVGGLVGRDPESMDAAGVARAAIESVAENTADAVVSPLLWGAAAGPAGLLGYRAVNTLDAMFGHRNARYEDFGWAAARLDDVANLVPARATAVLTAACAPLVGGSPRRALRTWRRDARHHPSPNAGPVEAAFAGALGIRLGGVNVYGGRVEDRGTLGDGPAPTVADAARTARLSALVGAAATVLAAALAVSARR